jgi:hypothetical protein
MTRSPAPAAASASRRSPRIQRLGNAPIIHPGTPGASDAMGTNINGPSLIRVPEWLPNPLGRYYLYFAHHQGKYIRLAFADHVEGPWSIHPAGTLHCEQTRFNNHIASPDVHVDHDRRRLVMYFHGCCSSSPAIPYQQITCAATSADGLSWQAHDSWLANSYLRVFRWQERTYGISMPGLLWRAVDPFERFELRPTTIFGQPSDRSAEQATHRPRHFAVEVVAATLRLYFTCIGDTPERLLYSEIDLTMPYEQWRASPPQDLLRPERTYEGADLPVETSRGGAVHHRVNALRDPAFFEDTDGKCYLLYSVAGEAGIALAALEKSVANLTNI